MRNLHSQELQVVNGGNTALIGGAAFVGSMLFLYWASRPSSQSCETLYRKVVSYQTDTTPVYDNFGVYIGDNFITYEDVNYVPVTVCH